MSILLSIARGTSSDGLLVHEALVQRHPLYNLRLLDLISVQRLGQGSRLSLPYWDSARVTQDIGTFPGHRDEAVLFGLHRRDRHAMAEADIADPNPYSLVEMSAKNANRVTSVCSPDQVIF